MLCGPSPAYLRVDTWRKGEKGVGNKACPLDGASEGDGGSKARARRRCWLSRDNSLRTGRTAKTTVATSAHVIIMIINFSRFRRFALFPPAYLLAEAAEPLTVTLRFICLTTTLSYSS